MAELDIAEAYILQSPYLLVDRRVVLEELTCIVNTHIKNVRDVLAVISDFQGLPVISLTLAYIACNVDIGKEVHLDLINAVSRTRLTASALGVK